MVLVTSPTLNNSSQLQTKSELPASLEEWRLCRFRAMVFAREPQLICLTPLCTSRPSKHSRIIRAGSPTDLLLQLILTTIIKNQERAEIEFVHYGLELVSSCIGNPVLRPLIID